jgi:DNA (cytosine-5)-methyltransferase 1
MKLQDLADTSKTYVQKLRQVERNQISVRRREINKESSSPIKKSSTQYKNWKLSKVKKEADKKLYSVVSFFCGSGGSSTGYKMSGGDIRFVNDFQEICIQNYLHNYPDTPNICSDIRNLSGKQILKKIGMKPRELDILDGSPPCPPFSMSGNKKKGWNKTKLVYGKLQKNIEDLTFDFIKLAKTIQPKVIVCENVKGLTMTPVRSHFQKMISEFQGIGYQTEYKVLNSVDYGVAQKRERVFIVSIRNDILEGLGHQIHGMVFPSFTSRIFPSPLKGQYSLQDAIFDLLKNKKNIQEGEQLESIMKTQSKYDLVKKLKKNPIAYQSVGDVNPNGSLFQTRRVPWDEPSHCLTEKGLETTFFSHLHPDKDRGLTTHEAMRIMGLPEGYKLLGTLDERLSVIGLMVAPPQMFHLSNHIYENVLKPLR